MAFGVLLDTPVVRSVLVTALTLDVGRWMWWPNRMGRIPQEPFWNTLSYSNKSWHVLQLTGAKTAETRARRLDKSITLLASGKAR